MHAKKPTMLAIVTVTGLLLGLVIFGRGPVIAQVTDTDGDGIPDAQDQCLNSDLSLTVVIDGCNSGVRNLLFSSGCTLSDLLAQCAVGASNHGKYVKCVANLTNSLKRGGVITGRQKGALQSCAARANIP